MIWDQYDRSGDGEIDRNEARRLFREFLCQPNHMFDYLWELMDRDESGTLDKIELAAFLREHSC
jgi:hypothetical protein